MNDDSIYNYGFDKSLNRASAQEVNGGSAIYDANADIAGQTIAIGSSIGGWNVGPNALSAGTGSISVGFNLAVTGGDDVRIYAGNDTLSTAPFRVTESGVMTATAANITGTITATTGTIGGWTIGATALTSGSGANTVGLDSGGANPALYAGSATPASAPFRVSQAGSAVFKDITMGGTTLQYVITNSGIFSFGDGSDGTVTISADTTLTSDKYYDSLTVNSAATLNPGGYRIFVKDTLTLSGNGVISRPGTNGGNGVNGGFNPGGGGTPGTLSTGYLIGAASAGGGSSGIDKGAGGTTTGTAGASPTNSLGSNGSSGGAGGVGAGSSGTSVGGAGGTATAANVKLTVGVQLAQLLDVSSSGATVKYSNSGGGGGGGGGAGDGPNSTSGGGGGGGACAGGIVAIYAKKIVIGAGSSITSPGGTGGNGGNSGGFNAGGGGGGAGGNGGIIILTYNALTNSGSLTCAAGSGGGVGTGNGTATSGTIGSAGTIYQFSLSL